MTAFETAGSFKTVCCLGSLHALAQGCGFKIEVICAAIFKFHMDFVFTNQIK